MSWSQRPWKSSFRGLEKWISNDRKAILRICEEFKSFSREWKKKNGFKNVVERGQRTTNK